MKKMKEFISILISFIFMSMADSIDSAFNNLISIDAIVVTGSFFLIDSIFKSFGEIGIYTYRTTRKNEWQYLWFNIIFGILMGIIVLIFKNVILDIFDLSYIQKDMLSILLNFYILYVVLGRFANGIFEIIRLKGNLKLYRKSLIVYYVSLVGLDALAYLFTKNLTLLFVATIISWFISIIYMLYNLKLKFEFPNKESFKNVIKYGFAYSSERLLSRIFLLLYGVVASHMGTENYSIHTICYSVCLTLEIITNAYQATLMIKVPDGKTYEEQYEKCMNMRNKCFPLTIVLNFMFAIIYLIISHGSLPLYKCFPYIIFYSFGVFGLYPYETYKTLCITQGKSVILLIGSIIGVIIRFLICLLFINTSISLFIFGIVNFIDFYCRSIVYRIVLNKLYKKHRLNV
jgi:Na+-driven multidrug efflux pump